MNKDVNEILDEILAYLYTISSGNKESDNIVGLCLMIKKEYEERYKNNER